MLSIIIPTKEEPYVNSLIQDIEREISVPHEIIVVDKSAMPPKLVGARLVVQKSSGLGNAFVEGLAEAKGDVILLMDGDGSHDPKYVNEMLKYIKDYDIVLGSKYVPGGYTEDYRSRVFVSKVFNRVIAWVLGLKVRDLMSGFCMFRRSVFDGIRLQPRGYKIVLEIIYKSKARVKEVPIRFYKRKAGESKVGFGMSGWKEVWRIFIITMKLRFNLYR